MHTERNSCNLRAVSQRAFSFGRRKLGGSDWRECGITSARSREAVRGIRIVVPEYYGVFQELVKVGTRPETRIEIATPVIGMRKSEIIQRGIELDAPLHLTWSCYQGEDLACGVCDSCVLRLRAFAQAGCRDPIVIGMRVKEG